MATAATNSPLVNEPNSGAGLRFAVDVNRLFTDKVKPGDKRFWRFNMTFTTERLTAAELLNSIHAGYAWTAPHQKVQHERPNGKQTTFRVKRNVIAVTAIGLDSDTEDERSTLAWWKAEPFFVQHGTFAHTTASHRPDAPRCRVVFVLAEPLPVDDAELLLRALHEYYPHVDHSATDASRIFYGARGCQFVAPGHVLPDDVAQALILPLKQREEDLRAAAEARRAALASSHSDRKANAGAVASYVASVKARRLADIAGAVEGTGERHRQLIEAAFRLGSLRGAPWLDDAGRRVLLGVEDELVGAAQANGYAAKYGEDATRREVQNSVALGERSPAIEPNWRDVQGFFAVGDLVAVVHQRRVLARGHVVKLRKGMGDADYLFRLDSGSAWYPRAWLRHDDSGDGRADDWPDEPPDAPSAGEPPDDSGDADAVDSAAQAFFSAAGPALDGRQRNIYAGLVSAPALEVDLPDGKYLGDVLDVASLPRHCQLNANTGTGKTSFAVNIPGQVLLVTSSTVALEQIRERRRAAGEPVDVYYHSEKSAKADSQLIVTTYESFARVLKIIDASRFSLVVDEVHNFAASSSRAFRGKALDAVVDTLEGDWLRVVLMSGTPMPSSHPALRKFQQVNVISQVRGQHAQRIVYRQTDADGRKIGRKMDTLLALCDLNRTHLIFLNDKKKKLDTLRAGLIARGFAPDEVAILNSDTKTTPAGVSVIQRETIPDGARVLIATSVLVEAANLRDKLDCVHLFSPIHPYLAQQLVNRLRTSAAGVVYWYNAGDGRAQRTSIVFHHNHFLREARSQVNHLNQFARIDPRDDSDEARLRRRSMRLWAGHAGELVRVDEDEEAGTKWWDISYLGVDHATFSAVEELAGDNPLLYQNMLKPFGWEWEPDTLLVVGRPNAAERQTRAELAGELRQEREDAHQQRVQTIRDAGEAWATVTIRNSATDGATLRAAGDALRLKRELLGDARVTTAQDSQAWTLACDLVLDAGDSKRKVNTAARRLKLARLRGHCQFTDAFAQAFAVGEVLTAEEVHRRVLAVFAGDALMAFHAANRYRYHFSQQATPRISQQRAVELLGDMFTLKRTSRRDAAGAVEHVWRVVDDMPLGASVATFAKSIKQFSVYVATNGSGDAEDDGAAAFAFTSAAGLPTTPAQATPDAPAGDSSDLLDWLLATWNDAGIGKQVWQKTPGW